MSSRSSSAVDGSRRRQAVWALTFGFPSTAVLLAGAFARGDARTGLVCLGLGGVLASLLLLAGARARHPKRSDREILCSFYRIPIVGPFARFGNYLNRRLFGFDVDELVDKKSDNAEE